MIPRISSRRLPTLEDRSTESSPFNRASVSLEAFDGWGLDPWRRREAFGGGLGGARNDELTSSSFPSAHADNKDGGVEGEKKQGKELAAAALEAGVKHFIYSSFVAFASSLQIASSQLTLPSVSIFHSVDMGGLETSDIPQFVLILPSRCTSL